MLETLGAFAPVPHESTSRTTALRQGIDQLTAEIREGLASAIGEAEGGAERVLKATETAKPEIGWMRDAALEASERITASGIGIAEQQDRFAALLATIDDGVGNSETRLAALTTALAEAQGEASRLTAETGPALVAALVQVKEAAAHAAERAREAIEGVIPDSAGKLSEATREALETAIREGIEERLRGVEAIAAKAVESAREASDRLTQQMLSLGQSSAALEHYFEKSQADLREKDSEAFARRVSLLIDSMNSAAIDVGKILSDEVDDKAWTSYLGGNRGVFTRRAVRLLDNQEAREVAGIYQEGLSIINTNSSTVGSGFGGGGAAFGRGFEAELGRPYGAWMDAFRSIPLPPLPDAVRANLTPLLPELSTERVDF